ncbi:MULTISPECIES: hypothetical protein [Anaerostipes]|uniref:hypothetical protein n=1 Tax=Anaerostipes TaxID=207244 RepID=UPI00095239D1|nr:MULTISPECIES: hypothetical protein [Anaerostipes]MCI5622623.1 hypothetical protein [Anaerostipes sp.]OLR58314.1 hypothetical protein BHF70_00950 [Anaerostipes sp. 494a]
MKNITNKIFNSCAFQGTSIIDGDALKTYVNIMRMVENMKGLLRIKNCKGIFCGNVFIYLWN